MEKKDICIGNMECAACSASVERVLKKLDGVQNVSVNLATEKAHVEYDTTKVTLEKIEQTIVKTGFTVVQEEAEQKEIKDKSQISRKIRLILSVAITTALMILSMVFSAFPVVQCILASMVMITGYTFYTKGYKNLFLLHPNMDSLVAVGTSASYLYSMYNLLRGNETHLYFDGVATIITLVMLGKYLESRSKDKTGQAIRNLMQLQSDTATVFRNGLESTIATKRVVVGDIVIVKPGEKLPVDGVISQGSTAIDESLLTGESMPVDKKIGDSVFGATINTTGSIRYTATKVGSDTALANIIKLVKDAQGSKAPIARIADTVAGYFVPTVMLISLLTFILWKIAGASSDFALSCAVSVLVIACPCSLGLATPIAFMVSSGKGASLGILFRKASAVELLNKVSTIAFDKTGTLTQGKSMVTDIIAEDPSTLLSLAASVEQKSEHPLSKAIVQEAKDKNLSLFEVSDFQALVGQGVTAKIDGKIIIIGNQTVIKENPPEMQRLASEGKTPLLVQYDGKVLGIIAIADTIRPETIETLDELKRMGISTIMLTGDNQRTAEAIAKKIGVTTFHAAQMPGDKEKTIRAMKQDKKIIAMVGDGINDAPSLEQADVGIAVGSATDIAKDSADVILVRNNLMDVALAVKLSKATVRNIKENLFWAFFYNCLGIPVAAGLLTLFGGPTLSPMVAALCMSLSSVTVVTNALRLNRFKA